MVQGGDIASGDGTGTTSIYDGEFDDENLEWREMDAAGLVCSANRGKNTNGSQFFVTLEACPHLNAKHTIFGRVVAGEDTLARIAKVPVDAKDCPMTPVLVSRCGELERKKKSQQQQKRDSRQEESAIIDSSADDRGRRRKSDLSPDGVDAIPPDHARRNRRQSDNIVDEGKRGRPRIRSRSRSDEQVLKETDGEDGMSDSSDTQLHKRKRSPSPSRATERRATDGEKEELEERRRRSLPNQYRQNQRKDRDYDDEARYRPSPRRDDGRLSGRRNDDRYRPSRDRYADDGRLGGGSGDGYDQHEPPVKFKGRGAMKYREPDRAW
jgi:peptidyl-prolyl isomerase G (cyclophilin G)